MRFNCNAVLIVLFVSTFLYADENLTKLYYDKYLSGQKINSASQNAKATLEMSN